MSVLRYLNRGDRLSGAFLAIVAATLQWSYRQGLTLKGWHPCAPLCRRDVAFFIELSRRRATTDGFADRSYRRLGSLPRQPSAPSAPTQLGPWSGLRFGRFRSPAVLYRLARTPGIASRALATAFLAYVIATVAILFRNLGLYDMPLAPIFVSSSPYFLFWRRSPQPCPFAWGRWLNPAPKSTQGWQRNKLGPPGGRKRSKIVYSSFPVDPRASDSVARINSPVKFVLTVGEHQRRLREGVNRPYGPLRRRWIAFAWCSPWPLIWNRRRPPATGITPDFFEVVRRALTPPRNAQA